MELRIIVLSLMAFGCQTAQEVRETRTVNDIHLRLSLMQESFERYKNDGPFSIEEDRDVVLSISADERREFDVYRTKGNGSAPIVIISHGNYSGKRAHADQARRLASWGFHVIVMELPNRDQWLENGRRIFDLANFLQRWPKFLGSNVDGNQIILVGHSFGGSAATLAAAQGAPVLGLVLLDPAVVHPTVTVAMDRVMMPAVLLGADTKKFSARGRSMFRKRWAGEFAEISVIGATHDDAQGPSMYSNFTLGWDPFTDNSQRTIFKASLVSAAVSLANSGNLEQFRRELMPEAKMGQIISVMFKR